MFFVFVFQPFKFPTRFERSVTKEALRPAISVAFAVKDLIRASFSSATNNGIAISSPCLQENEKIKLIGVIHDLILADFLL